jgi:Type I restriction modification DNA specificity domain
MRDASTVEEACVLVTDGTHYTPTNAGVGTPFLTVKDVTDAALDFTNCSFITDEDFRAAKAGHSAPQRGDVLFSKDGTVGKVHVVGTDQPFAVLSSLAILRPRHEIVDSAYLGHALRSPTVLNDALKRKTGSAIRRIVLSDLKQVRLPIPSLDESAPLGRSPSRDHHRRDAPRRATPGAPARKGSLAPARDPCGGETAFGLSQKEVFLVGTRGLEPPGSTPRILLPEWIANALRGAA